MIDKAEIENEFISKLRDYLEPEINSRVKTLSLSERQKLIGTVKKYYEYLRDNGIPYGKLALEVVNNQGEYGIMANGHLKHQCVFDGIKAEKVPKVREQLIISLAYHDMKMRASSDQSNNYDFVKEIEDYHIAVFQSLATVYAWGGLAFRELVGSGSWSKLYEAGGRDIDAIIALFTHYKKSDNYSSTRLLDSLRHTWTHYRDNGIGDPYFDDVAFRPRVDAVSKEYLAKLYDVPESRIEEVTDAPTPETPMVAYKHYLILAATDHPVNHEIDIVGPLTPQVSPEMQAIIASYKLTNITADYRAEYKGSLTHYVPIDYTYTEKTVLL